MPFPVANSIVMAVKDHRWAHKKGDLPLYAAEIPNDWDQCGQQNSSKLSQIGGQHTVLKE